MKVQVMKKHIEASAEAARDNGQTINIYKGVPIVAIDSLKKDSDEYFFQGEQASELLQEAEKASNKFGVSEEDYILYIAQSW